MSIALMCEEEAYALLFLKSKKATHYEQLQDI